MKQQDLISILPFNKEQKELVGSLLQDFNDQQLTWLAGYLTGITLPQTLRTFPVTTPGIPVSQPTQVHTDAAEITVLYGSRTGNGSSIAKDIKHIAESKGLKINLQDMNEYANNKLKDEKNLLVIVSTHGEGVPPIAAEEFYNFLFSKRAPKFTNTKFSVLALGDSSYVHFCKTGKDIDQQLEVLGGTRLFPRVDCDVEFTPKANEWIDGILKTFQDQQTDFSTNTVNSHPVETATSVYTKQNPFKAKILERIMLNGKGSAKETFHYEISLEGSGLSYEPGDAIGVYATNSFRLVNELLDLLTLDGNEKVVVGETETTLFEALSRNFEISLLTPDVITRYNELIKNEDLAVLFKDAQKLKEYIYGRDVVDLLEEYPSKLSASDLTGILRKLQPRLYSISSSLSAHPDEVHLTISSVRYTNKRYKEGICSTFLSDRIKDDEEILVYVEKNPEFKLPSNTEAPVIMVGPGTGIAPFRAFLEERHASGSKGKNWLFFGDQHFTTDFLYQSELQTYHKKGLLTRLNVAFSRDTAEKVYVQHKMEAHAHELYRWLEEGAYFYVCGDMKHMWADVNQTLLKIISKEGGLSDEKAEEYLKSLKKARRYMVDVY